MICYFFRESRGDFHYTVYYYYFFTSKHSPTNNQGKRATEVTLDNKTKVARDTGESVLNNSSDEVQYDQCF